MQLSKNCSVVMAAIFGTLDAVVTLEVRGMLLGRCLCLVVTQDVIGESGR